MSDIITPTPEPTPYAAAPPAPAKGGALTLWALIVAIVAIVAAIIPGLSFVAWLPAVAATILGIIGLVSKAASRGKAITAVILGPIALLVAIIVSVGTFAAGVSDALPSVSSGSETTVDEPAEEEPEATDVGTRENPAPAGSTVVISDNSGETYEISFGKANLDATKAIAAENMFNDKADKGFRYILVPVTFTYVGTETGTPWIDVQLEFVSAAGTTHDSTSTFAVAPKPITDINELYPEASATGNLVLMVPEADIEKGTLAVSTIFSEKYFVSIV